MSTSRHDQRHSRSANVAPSERGQPRPSGASSSVAALLGLPCAGCALIAGVEGTPYLVPPPPERSAYAELVMRDQPLAYWRLGETDSTVARDSSSQYHGSYVGNVSHVDGAVGDGDLAASFAIQSYVGLSDADSNAFNFGKGGFAIEAWVQPRSLLGGDPATVFAKEQPEQPAMGDRQAIPPKGLAVYLMKCLQQNLDNSECKTLGAYTLLVSLTDSCTNAERVYLPESGFIEIPADRYTHIVITRSETEREFLFYVNSSLTRGSGAIDCTIDNAAAVTIGAVATKSVIFNELAGAIDELAVYTYALSPQQILRHYCKGSGQCGM